LGAALVVALAGFTLACGGAHTGANADAGPGGTDGAVPGDGGTCPGAGEMACGNQCINTGVDHDNCGSCGHACGASQVCVSSGCADSCPASLEACGGTCVDSTSDNNNCGSCGHACGTGMGCVDSACVPEVPVGPDPAKCANGGPPITVDPGNGTPTCTGNIVAATFTYGLCTCQNVGTPSLDSALNIDAYDSTMGPYQPNGLGGSCGANGTISSTDTVSVTGDLRTTGPQGLGVNGAFVVKQSIHVLHAVALNDTLTVGLDGYAAGFGGDGAPATITRDLYTPDCGNVPGNVTVNGTCKAGAISVPPPCACAPGQMMPVQALVTYYKDPAHNDNALINLNPDVFATAAAAPRLELPCGYYYLSAVNGSSARAIGVHGRTAIFIGASVNASADITFTLTPSATLDVFVAGDFSTSGQLNTGNEAYPAHSRMWVNGSVTTSSGSALNGLFWAGYGTFHAQSDLTMFGSVFANNYDGTSLTTIHYDRAASEAGTECPTHPIQTCGQIAGGSCQKDSDCCQPLYCNMGTCQDVIIE
jgi:hypothetical protein